MKQEADFLAENAVQLATIPSSSRATDPEEKLGIIPNGTLAAKSGRIVWEAESSHPTIRVDPR